MTKPDPDVELITSPGKVAAIRRLSALRSPKGKLSVGKPPLLRMPGQRQSLLAYTKATHDSKRTSISSKGSLQPSASSRPKQFKRSSLGSKQASASSSKKASASSSLGVKKAIPSHSAPVPELRYRQASSQGNPHAAPAAPLASTSPSADGSEEENEDEEETVDIPVAAYSSDEEEIEAAARHPMHVDSKAAKVRQILEEAKAARLRQIIANSQYSDVDEDEEMEETPVQQAESAQRKIREMLRAHRPILTNYRLGAALMYIPIESPVETTEYPGWYKPPIEHFVHTEVIALLDKNGLGHLRESFETIGAYIHADIVKLSLQIQGLDGWEWKMHLMKALQLLPQSVDWNRLLHVLSEYVRPY